MKTKKLLSAMLILTLAMPFAACKKEETPETTTTTTTVMASEPSETTTTEATTTTETEPQLYDPDLPYGLNPITGVQDMDLENVGNKPITIVVNNVYAAMPQRGVSDADAIFEYETEGGISRLLCVFADVNTIPEIGSLRSARVVTANLSAGLGAIFVHFGREARVVSYFSNNNIVHIDGNYLCAGKYSSSDYEDGYVDLPGSTFFWRDKDWASKRAIEHTAVSDGTHIKEALEYKGIDLASGEDETPMMFNFVPDNSKDIENATETCSAINVYFSASNDDAYFEYNEGDGLYYKSQYGDPQIDENNGNQIAVTNVFVLYVRVALADDNYRTDYFFEEGGSGYYICDGKIINVTWTKTDVHEPIKVYNEDGEEVEVNRGKSYICLVRSSNADKTEIYE